MESNDLTHAIIGAAIEVHRVSIGLEKWFKPGDLNNCVLGLLINFL